MRVLLIIPDLRRGGAERVFVTLARGLAARGHDVSLLLFYHEIEFQIPAEVAIHFLTRPSRRMRFGWLDKHILSWALKRWLPSVAPFDLIVSSLSFTSEVVHLAGIEGVWHHVHATLSAELDRLRLDHKRKARRRLRRYRRIFDGQNLIAVSDGIAIDLHARIGLSHSDIVTIYNPHDLKEIRTLAATPDAAIPSQPYVVHVGRFVKGKRHDILLDAFVASEIPHDLVLLTKESPALRRLIESRGLSSRVSVVGVQDNPFPWYAGASALILSSDYEGLPNVLIEALASGTPVISTDCRSGPHEILRGPLQRYLSPVEDVSAMARNLRSVIEAPPDIDPALLNKFAMRHAFDKFEELCAPKNRATNLIYQDEDGDWVQRQQGLMFFTRDNRKISSSRKKLSVSDRWFYNVDIVEGDTIIDLGAGVGDEIFFMSQCVGPNGRIVAIEANPTTYRCLKKTVEANGLRNVTAVNVAISDRVGETIIEENEESNLANRIGVEHGVKISCTTLDKLLASLGIQDVTLVKVNVEGAEAAVLRGSLETLDSTRNWVISCHDFMSHLPGYEASATYSDVRKLLTQAGLRILPRRSDSRLPIPFFVYASRE